MGPHACTLAPVRRTQSIHPHSLLQRVQASSMGDDLASPGPSRVASLPVLNIPLGMSPAGSGAMLNMQLELLHPQGKKRMAASSSRTCSQRSAGGGAL
jgi:hypothetical protein